jgi:hypothetical protein
MSLSYGDDEDDGDKHILATADSQWHVWLVKVSLAASVKKKFRKK